LGRCLSVGRVTAGATLDCKLDGGFAVAEPRLPVGAVQRVGCGKAVLLNLSPQRYLQYRAEGTATDAMRDRFVGHVRAGGAEPWLKITSGGRRPARCEATCWHKDGRTLVFVVQNAEVTGSVFGGGGAEGLRSQIVPIQIELPAEVADVVDERSGRQLGAGRRFTFEFNPVEAVLFSFAGRPPR
jgi:hypothetical protein